MKKSKEFKLNTKTDLKIFVLFLLDNIRYPVDKTTVMSIVEENTNEIIIDNEEEAQQKIVNIIRKLEDSAEIVISRGGGDEIVV